MTLCLMSESFYRFPLGQVTVQLQRGNQSLPRCKAHECFLVTFTFVAHPNVVHKMSTTNVGITPNDLYCPTK